MNERSVGVKIVRTISVLHTFAELQSDGCINIFFPKAKKKAFAVWSEVSLQIHVGVRKLTSSECFVSSLSVPVIPKKRNKARRNFSCLAGWEKNKLMHGKWCNSTRAKSIHPARGRWPPMSSELPLVPPPPQCPSFLTGLLLPLLLL